MCIRHLYRLLARTIRKKKLIYPDDIPHEKMLIWAIKHKKYDLIMQLYIKGAQGRIVDDEGNNLLHLAVKTGDENVVRAVLLLFGYKYDLFSATNKQGKRPIDLTKSAQMRDCIRLIEKNYAAGTTRAKQTVTARTSAGTTTAKAKNPDFVLLSMDGGGIRGLALVRILMHIERKLGRKFWDVVDWAAGTSTGGVLSLALAKGKTLEECQLIYLRMKDQAFEGKPPYDDKALERIFKRVFKEEFMDSITRPRLLITSARVDVAPPKLKLFRNYPPTQYDSGIELLDRGFGHISDDPAKILIWQVARCTSAAPSYFPPFNEIYADGGIICNNPTLELMTEFVRHKGAMRKPAGVKPACVISIGTGWPPPRGVTIFSPQWLYQLCNYTRKLRYYRSIYYCLIEQITESNGRPVSHCRTFCDVIGAPFFRISPKLSKEVRLDETRDSVLLQMMWDVEVHLSKSNEVNDLIKVLKRHIEFSG